MVLAPLTLLTRLGLLARSAGAAARPHRTAAAPAAIAIEVRGLVCRFVRRTAARARRRAARREHAALDGLDLVVPSGRVTAVVGPSGAGKSTLLRAIAGLVTPDAGDVLFDGASVLGRPPERRRLGVVFQSYALFPHLTVADNVAFPLRVRGVGRRQARRRIRDLLVRLEIEPLAARHPHQLSGGERQRVALARALAAEPRALLLDEPLAALDARLRLALRADLASRLRAAGLTALYVTHDQEEAMALGDQVAVLRRGRLEQVGTPEALYRSPATPFVARFIGEANVLPVTWDPAARTLAGRLGTLEGGRRHRGSFQRRHRRARPAARAPARRAPPACWCGRRRCGRPARGSRTAGSEARRQGQRRPDGAEAAHLRGRVVASTFLGGRRRLAVAVAGAREPLKVDLPAIAAAPAPGEVVWLALDLSAAVLLPRAAPATTANGELETWR